MILALLLAAAASQEAPFRETLDVERVLVDARVLDGRGRPILGLGPGDFRARVDGREARIESVQWVPAGTPPVASVAGAVAGSVPAQPPGGPLPPQPPGRLIVLLFQKDLQPQRTPGLIRMAQEAQRLLGGLAPGDRVAVLTFDWHLKLRQDFTDDRERLRALLRRVILLGAADPIAPGPFPSLAAHFDAEAARRAATPEQALRVLAGALGALPGAKSLVLFGWGLGRLGATGVRMEPDYGPAREALAAARTAVFSLDVTEADFHSLEAGLQQVAADTGGFYARTHVFPGAAIRLLEDALAGHYVIAIERRPAPGHGRVEIRLARRSGRVLAREDR